MTMTTLGPLPQTSDSTCENCIKTLSTKNVVSSSASAYSYGKPESSTITDSNIAESNKSNTAPAEPMIRTATTPSGSNIQKKSWSMMKSTTGPTNIRGTETSTTPSRYFILSTEFASPIVISIYYYGISARYAYNYAAAFLLTLPLALT